MDSNVSELLEKISHLLKWSNTKPLSKLEHDLVLQYIRDLYEQVDALKTGADTPVKQQPVVHKHTQPEELIAKKAEPNEHVIVVNDVKPEPQVIQPQVNIAPSVVNKESEPVIKKEVEEVRPEPVAETINAVMEVNTPVSKATSLNEKIKSTGSLNEKVKSAGTEVHKRITSSRNLKDLIDLNRRFVFVSELFKGNGEAFSKAVTQIDEMKDYQSAESYLKNDLILGYGWIETDQSAKLFRKLVKQKFGVE